MYLFIIYISNYYDVSSTQSFKFIKKIPCKLRFAVQKLTSFSCRKLYAADIRFQVCLNCIMYIFNVKKYKQLLYIKSIYPLIIIQ